jgi:hypothetical protein
MPALTCITKAVACVAADKTAEAKDKFEALMKQHGPTAEVACAYTALLLKDGDRPRAPTVLEQRGDHGGVLHRLAQIIGNSHEPAQGRELYRRLAAQRPVLRRNFFAAMRGCWRAGARDDATSSGGQFRPLVSTFHQNSGTELGRRTYPSLYVSTAFMASVAARAPLFLLDMSKIGPTARLISMTPPPPAAMPVA